MKLEGAKALVTGGAGVVAHYAIQLAKWAGARVVTTVSSAAKAAHARAAGADVVINYRADPVVERVLDTVGGVDHIVEVDFGANLPITARILRQHGVVASYASARELNPPFPYVEFFRLNPVIRPVFVYTMPDTAKAEAHTDIARWLTTSKPIFAIAARYALSDVVQAHLEVERGQKIGLMGSTMLACLGLITSVWAEKFDHAAAVTNFVVAPLSLLSGTFYSIDALSPVFRGISHANPFFYVISGFRYGFLGTADSPVAFGALLLLAINLGLLLGRNESLARLLDPLLIALNSLPKVALAPLFIMWFGIGIGMKIILTATIVFFLVFVNTYHGVRNVDSQLIDILRLMGARERHIMTKVIVPSALQWVFAGLQLSVPYALIGAVVGEMMAANRGLGYLLADAAGQLDTGGVFAALLGIILLALLLQTGVKVLERQLTPWARASEMTT